MDRFRFLSRKQAPNETLEQFWHSLDGMAAECEFGTQTESLVHDIFILNMRNAAVQEKLCTEPKSTPQDALQFAIAYEEGTLRQKSYGDTAKTIIKEEPICNIQQQRKSCTRCGAENFTIEHLAQCKAKGKRCNNCGIIGHFSRACKKPTQAQNKNNQGGSKQRPPRRVNWVDEESEEETSGSEEKAVLSIDGQGTTPFMMKGKLNKNKFNLMIDSGSPVTIIEQEELRKILKYNVLFLRPIPKQEKYVDFNKRPLDLMGFINCELEVGKKKINKVRVLVARKGAKSIVGRDWLKLLGYKIEQKKQGQSKKSINFISNETEKASKLIENMKTEFSNLFERQGRIKNHQIHAKLHPEAVITQQKGRRVPIQLQDAVNQEIKKLLREGHIEKVGEIKEDVFLQPTVITVKKDRSVKIALDARELNKNVVKDKYPMPNLDNLMDMIAEQTDKGEGTTFFTSLDMNYAYGQVKLSENTAKHCNFQIIGGEATGVYRFKTGFYGLTTMPTEFQRIMDTTLAGIANTFAFIDDILIVTRGDEEGHIEKVRQVLKRLDEANVSLKAEKCTFAAKQIEWVGYKLSQEGVEPINSKVQGITDRLKPTNLKQLRSYLGAVNQLNKFIPDLAKLCFPFRTLLKKENDWNWGIEQETAFKKVNEEIKRAVKVNHFKRNCPLRVICDASKSGLGAVLQQQVENEWKPVCFASRFLTELESKYSVNELELLAIVWAIEYFRSYVYGVKFQIISDHMALATVLKGQKGNKTYSSRLTRWVDRLLPFDFEVIHGPGRDMGLADYLSRKPSPHNENTAINASTLWNDWFTVNVVSEFTAAMTNQNTGRRDSEPIRDESNTAAATGANASNYTTIKAIIDSMPRDNSKQRKTSELAIMPPAKRTLTIATIDKLSKEPIKSSISKIGENILAGTYESDELLQKIVNLNKSPDKRKIEKLPAIWQQKFNELSLDENNFIYLDERLIIPEELQKPIFRSLHWGHPGRDAMLGAVADIWWPHIHRDIVLLAQTCPNCQNAGKNLKTLKSQNEYGKITAAAEHNDEIAIDFAGPFANAADKKKYLLVAIDQKTGWPSAMFLRKPNTEKVIEFLEQYVANFGIPKRIRTDPATVFNSEKFKEFCKEHVIRHVQCPVRDHRGNGKVERLIRTINERIRADKSIVLEKGNRKLARTLFAIRQAKSANKNSPYEEVFGKEPNTVKSIIIEKPKMCLEQDTALDLQLEDFPRDDDSLVFIRDKTTGTKLESKFKKAPGKITEETNNTVTIEKSKTGKSQIYSKRDVAITKKQRKCKSASPTKRDKSLERKIAALKDYETRQEMELNQPLKTLIPKATQVTPKKARRPRKQPSPKKSVTQTEEEEEVFVELSDEEEETGAEKTEGEEIAKEEKQSQNPIRHSRQSERQKKKPDRFGHNIMVTNVETAAKQKPMTCCKKNKLAIEAREEIRKELEQLPNFSEMSAAEIEAWIHE